ncbi:MAG: hypothetical protein JW716_01540 [Candidatus Aenigmarchaeota archaeon]|nr:hypothetical protein [Candidatus Aenigmarchaeota archaeon]
MKESIMIVIAAIVVLVIALVLLTIFGQGMNPVGSFSNQANLCRASGASSCQLTGGLPPGWSSTRYKVNKDGVEVEESCAQMINVDVCSDLS